MFLLESSNDFYACEGILPYILDPKVLSDSRTKPLLTVLTTNISTLQHCTKKQWTSAQNTQLFVHVKTSNDALVYYIKVL